jgi:UDP-N-acetylglucosamine transferase subunit ALG13
MIFVTVGTSSWNFTRLIKEMDHIAEEINEEVIIQIGYDKYEPKNAKYFRTTTKEEMERLYESARIIVSHAGIGAIISAIKHNKPIIVIPRRMEYGEHFDNHQVDIARELEREGIVKVVWDIKEIGKVLRDETINYEFRKNKRLVITLREYIKSLERNEAER